MSHLTRLPGIPDSAEIKPGMAHFAGSGPAGKTCGQCVHRGYWKKGKDKIDKATHLIKETQVKTTACKEFLRLSLKHGPAVNVGWAACKFFKERPL